MTRLLLVRHATHAAGAGVLAGRAPGVALSERGRDEAHRLAARLADLSLAAIYTSPLERTVETAEAIASHHGIPATARDGLQELDYGDWTGRRVADLEADQTWRRWNSERGASAAPGGESMADAQRRAVAVLGAISAAHPDASVVVVTHSEIIRAALLAWLDCSLDVFHRIDVAPASITTVDVFEGGAVIRSVNDTAHLDLAVQPPRAARSTARRSGTTR